MWINKEEYSNLIKRIEHLENDNTIRKQTLDRCDNYSCLDFKESLKEGDAEMRTISRYDPAGYTYRNFYSIYVPKYCKDCAPKKGKKK